MSGWACPKCKRRFTRKNQRHACGTGSRAEVLRGRSPELVALYGELEAFVKSLGAVELVARERYVLLRTARIFADLVMMSDCIRLAIHLPEAAQHAAFVKIVGDRRHVTHVAKLRTPAELAAMKPFVCRAYAFSMQVPRP